MTTAIEPTVDDRLSGRGRETVRSDRLALLEEAVAVGPGDPVVPPTVMVVAGR